MRSWSRWRLKAKTSSRRSLRWVPVRRWGIRSSLSNWTTYWRDTLRRLAACCVLNSFSTGTNATASPLDNDSAACSNKAKTPAGMGLASPVGLTSLYEVPSLGVRWTKRNSAARSSRCDAGTDTGSAWRAGLVNR